MGKRIFMFLVAIMMAICVQADMWTDPDTGYTWSYTVNGNTVEIYKGDYSAAISPSPTGAVSIPDTLGGKPVTSIGHYAFYDCRDLMSVTISSNVTNIEERAFTGCRGLTNMTIPSSVSSIGNYAFSSCYGLTSVTIPSSVTSIGKCVFSDCNGLVSVTIPDSVTSIGYGAFRSCSGLTSVTIPGSVTNIGNFAFENCRGLASVTISSSVTSIGYGAFEGCGGLTSVTIPQCVCASTLSEVFSAAYQSITNVAILAGVTSIGEYAFYDCGGLMCVTIPDSVTSIGYYAFYGCSELTAITVDDNNPMYKSVGGFLMNKAGTTLIQGVNGDVTIPSSVTSIGDSAFSGCRGLTSVTIPNSVTNIGHYAFSECNGLTSVHIADLAAWCRITFFDNPLSYAHNLYLNGMLVSHLVIPDEVTSIENYAFCGCSGLTRVTIPSSVTSIGKWAFSGCSGLTSATIPGSMTIINEYAFEGCSGLTNVTIPDNVWNIGRYAFSGCSGLTSMTIGNGVTYINEYAFQGCSGLTRVTIPDSVWSIGYAAFSGCSGLEEITLPFVGERRGISGHSVFGYIFGTSSYSGGTSTQQHYYYGGSSSYCIPSKLKEVIVTDEAVLGEWALSNCSGLTNVTIPNSVTNIAESAFSGCSGLTSVTIPNSVTSIGYDAFSGCSGLMSVAIPQCVCSSTLSQVFPAAYQTITNVLILGSVTSIVERAFSGCSGLMAITVDDVNPAYKSVDGLLLDKAGTTLIQGVNGDVTIPSSVMRIGDRAFCDCSLTSVKIPDSVNTIGEYAFFGCSDLKCVTIGNGVTYIWDCAFRGCNGLTSVTIPDSVTIIGESAFDGCSGLTSVTIGNSVASIGEKAFWCCSGLTSVTIPSSVTTIGLYAFDGCSGLTNVTISTSVRHIEGATFRGCSGLTSMTIPDSVWSIGDSTFSGCSGLTSVTIPSCVTRIGYFAFGGCSGLTSIVFEGNAPSVGDISFENVGNGCTAYVRRGSTGWGVAIPGMWNGIKIDYIDNMPADSPDVWMVMFNANGGTMAETSRVVTNECAVGELPAPTRDGHTFDGWFTASDGGSRVSDETVVTTNATFYAHWTAVVVPPGPEPEPEPDPEPVVTQQVWAVTFNANGGTVAETSRVVTNGCAVGELPAPTYDGHTFDGWFTVSDGGSRVSDETDITANITFYAHWTAVVVPPGPELEPEPEPVVTQQVWTVTFNANGGEGSMAVQMFTNGVVQALNENAFTRFGYDFAGWATNADGEVVYADGQRATQTSGQTLYAQWREIVAGHLDTSFAKAQVVLGALYGRDGVPVGTVQVKVGKISKMKGTVKVSATATVFVDGKAKKVMAKAVNVEVAAGTAAPHTAVKVAFAAPIGEMAFELAADGTFTLKNASYMMAEKQVGGKWTRAGAKVYVDGGRGATALPAGTIEELLPDGEPVIPKAGKWSFAKAATVKWAKPKKGAEQPEIFDEASGKGLIVDDTKGKTNLSGLKLTYTPKTGIFTGSFKIYAIQSGKLKKITVKVIGVVVDGKGWGSASGPGGVSFAVTVE